MRTFKIKNVAIPPDVIQIELVPEEFQRLAKKMDWGPLFENYKAILHIDGESRTVYFCQKVKKP